MVECKSCGFLGRVKGEIVKFCPKCGSRDILFSSLQEEGQKTSLGPTKDPLGLTPPYQELQVQKHSEKSSEPWISGMTVRFGDNWIYFNTFSIRDYFGNNFKRSV